MDTPTTDGPTTPQSLSSHFDGLSPESFISSRSSSPSESTTPPPATTTTTSPTESKPAQEPEKKPVKKRKSWGQQLPTPTTNLPPRKRAKTAEEKEQRRVERVLRNRAAAQKSREIKKQQLEKIEKERDDLKDQNELLQQKNKQLEQLQEQLIQQTQRLVAENQRLRQQSSSPSEKDDIEFDFSIPSLPSGTSFTLDPTSLLATPERSPALKLEESPCMTHQPAALMCDLPCLQGSSTSKAKYTAWVLAIIFLASISFNPSTALIPTLGWLLLRNPVLFSHLITSLRSSLSVIAELRHRMMTLVCSLVALAHLTIATAYSLQPSGECDGVGEASNSLNFFQMFRGKEALGTFFSRGSHSYEVAEGRGSRLSNVVKIRAVGLYVSSGVVKRCI